jgi:hypothetical protein
MKFINVLFGNNQEDNIDNLSVARDLAITRSQRKSLEKNQRKI